VVTDADITIVLTESGDFDAEGDIYVASPSISGTIDTIAYTGNTLSTNTLTGVTGIATGGHASGTQV
jgi:Na+(H+)/acetate symporter ActP